ncbi:MAG: hypothetical protein V3573_03310 [Desulfovibrionaceae bacterium]
MLLYFPQMHPECLAKPYIPGVLFFDPGLMGDNGIGRFRPEGLPLDEKSAHNLLEDCLRFGEQFVNPKDMALFGSHNTGTRRGESVSMLEGELTRRLGGERGKTATPEGAQAAHAQFFLLLAWALEERFLELQGLSRGVQKVWDNFGATLGLGDDDSVERAELQLDSLVADTHAPEATWTGLAWPRLLEALLVFLPKDVCLVVDDAEIVSAWTEAGVSLTPATEEFGLPPETLMAEAPAWLLTGRTHAPQGRPLLERVVRVAVTV